MTISCCYVQVTVDFPLQHMSHSNKKKAEAAVGKIRAGGRTNLSGGLFKGIDQHQQGTAAQQADTIQANGSTGDIA